MPKIGDKIEIVPSDNINCHCLMDGETGIIVNVETSYDYDNNEITDYVVNVKDSSFREGFINQFLDISDFKVIE